MITYDVYLGFLSRDVMCLMLRGMARLLNLRIKKTILLYNPKHNDFYPEIIPFFFPIYLQRRILKHALIRSRF
jgi:hypothetical protein